MRVSVNIVQKFIDSANIEYAYCDNTTLYFKKPNDKKATPFPRTFERIRNIFSCGDRCYILDDSEKIYIYNLMNMVSIHDEICDIKRVDKLLKYDSNPILIILAGQDILFYSMRMVHPLLSSSFVIKRLFYDKNNAYDLMPNVRVLDASVRARLRSANGSIHNVKTFGKYILYKTKDFIVCLKYDGKMKVLCAHSLLCDDKRIFNDTIDYDPNSASFILTNGTFYPDNKMMTDNKYCRANGLHMYIHGRMLHCVTCKNANTVSKIVAQLGGTLVGVNDFLDKYIVAKITIDNINKCNISYFENYQALTRYNLNKCYVTSHGANLEAMPTFLNINFARKDINNHPSLYSLKSQNIRMFASESIIAQACERIDISTTTDSILHFYFYDKDDKDEMVSSGDGVERQVASRFCTELSSACKDGFVSFDPPMCYKVGQLMHLFIERYNEKVDNIHPYFFHRLSILQGSDTKESLNILWKFKKDDYAEYFQTYFEYKLCPALLSELDMGFKSCDDFLEFILSCDLDSNTIVKYSNFAKGYFDYNPHTYSNTKLAVYHHLKKIIPKKVINPRFLFYFKNEPARNNDDVKLTLVFLEAFNSYSTESKRKIIANISGTSSWTGIVKINFESNFNVNLDFSQGGFSDQKSDKWKQAAYRIITCYSKLHIGVAPTLTNIKTLLEILSTADHGSVG